MATATAPATARFIVRGCRPVTVEVEGVFDAGAAVGFRALVPSLVGASEVTIDLTNCERIDEPAAVAVHHALCRIRQAGGVATAVRRR